MRINLPRVLVAGLLVILLTTGVYYIPPVHDHLAWRVDEWRTNLHYYFNPPDQAVFQPSQQSQLATIVAATMQMYQTPDLPTATVTPSPGPTFAPTATSTPLPASVTLSGVKYEDQHGRWNYCGPATFSMALRFWGWNGNRDVIGQAVMPGNTDWNGKPANKDKNAMPYEFQDYITSKVPGMNAIIRLGGDINVVKRLLAGGFPVVAEKGYYETDASGKFSWMGHYQFITGYNDATNTLLVQDTYLDGPNFKIKYDKFVENWRAFDYVFVVVYPYDRESQVLTLLGDYADDGWASTHALTVAQSEANSLTGINQYFAWFNVGTSYVALNRYVEAAGAYDRAFQLYAALGGDQSTRPFRMLWYQTGPYKAYFYSHRYTDVLNLANTTLNNTIAAPVLEESLYWRGQAEYLTGDTTDAIADYRAALKVHPNWGPATQALQDLGVAP